MKISWSPLAVERMAEVKNYILKDNPMAALKWAQEVFDRIENIQEFPFMGRIVPEANRKEIRELLFKNYRIIYRVGTDHISILTIRHGKQLLPSEDIE